MDSLQLEVPQRVSRGPQRTPVLSRAAPPTRAAARLRQPADRPRPLLVWWLLLSILLGGVAFAYSHVDARLASESAAQESIERLDEEISGRLHQWLDLAQRPDVERHFDASRNFSQFHNWLTRRPGGFEALPYRIAATYPEYEDRGLLSLLLELQSQVDRTTAAQIERVIALVIYPEPVLRASRSLRESASLIAMNILLDRWR